MSINKSYILKSKYLAKNKFRIKNYCELTQHSLPKINESWHIVTEKAINAFAFIQYILDTEKKIEQLYITSYSIRESVLLPIKDWQDSGILDFVYIGLTCFTKRLNLPCYEFLSSVKSDKFKVKYFHNHTKIALIKTSNNYFVLEGSGNFSENAQCEQYVLTNNQELYNFHKDWIEKEPDKY